MKENKDSLVKLSMLVLFVCVFFDVLTFQKVFYGYDILTSYLPIRIYEYQKLKTGALPLWCSEMGGGYPILAEGQGSFFYPLNWLFLIFPWDAAFNVFIVLHYFLGFWFMFLYAREINLSRPAAFLSAVLFTFNGFSTSRYQHFVILIVCVWMPLLFYIIEKIKKEKKTIYFQLISIVTALQFLAFFPQMFLYCFLATAAYAVVRLLNFKLIALFFLSAAVGLLLSGVQLLPTLELVEHSVRAKGVVSPHEVIRDSLSLRDIPELFFPDFSFNQSYMQKFKTVETQGYVGIIPAVLALLGIFKKRKKESLFFAALIPVALLLSFGAVNSISAYILSMPVFRFFAAPSRFLFFFIFCISILAGLGMDSLKFKNTFKVSLVLLIFIDLYIFSINRNFTKSNPEKFYTLPVNLIQFLERDRSIYRIFWEKGYEGLAPNINIVHGIDSANMHTPLILNRYWNLINLYLEGKNEKILNLLNVKYIFQENNSIVLNKQVMPRVFVVHQARFFKHEKDILKTMASDKFNPEHEVILEGEQKNMNSPSGVNFSHVKILKYSSEAVEIEADLKTRGYLVLSDAYFPGWKSIVDGKEIKIYIADHALRAIYLDKGKHKVQFYYSPASFKAGILVSLSGVLILLASFMLTRSKKFAPQLQVKQ